MAIVVSEYGKVLGLVTMDDLLSQIFGVLRDERAALQNLSTPGRAAARVAAELKSDAYGPMAGHGAGGGGRGARRVGAVRRVRQQRLRGAPPAPTR